MNPSIPNQNPHNDPREDQTWDEYQSTMYAIARMRGETPTLEPCSLGPDTFGIEVGQ